jgi:hypothetical protein
MQQFAPMYNRRALDILVTHLCESEKFQHVVEFKGGSRRNRVNMAATAEKMRALRDGAVHKQAGVARTAQDLPGPVRRTAEYAAADEHRVCAVAGLRPNQLVLMDTVYHIFEPERSLSDFIAK